MYISYTRGRHTENEELSKKWLWIPAYITSSSASTGLEKWLGNGKGLWASRCGDLSRANDRQNGAKMELAWVDGPKVQSCHMWSACSHGRRMWAWAHGLEPSLLSFWVYPVFRQVEGGQSSPACTLSLLLLTQQSFLFRGDISGSPTQPFKN